MQKALIALVQLPLRGYRLFISPLLGPRCRYYPSCSHYAMTAFKMHGLWRGGWLTLRRLGRCHPGSKHPYHDPVPDKLD